MLQNVAPFSASVDNSGEFRLSIRTREENQWPGNRLLGTYCSARTPGFALLFVTGVSVGALFLATFLAIFVLAGAGLWD